MYVCMLKNKKTMFKKIIFTFFAVIALTTYSNAQKSIADSAIFTPQITIHYEFQIPGGDLAKRFGNNSAIGGSVLFKTKKNWVWGAEGSFIYGSNLKEENIFNMLKTEKGAIIDGNGMYTDLRLYERGFNFYGRFGKVFPVFGPNPNSGILIMGGLGFLQHKIRIEVNGNSAPQLKDDYKKGYDRLTNGFAASEFIGYIHYSNRKTINFYAGIEITEAWTKNRRSFNFDQMKKDNTQRLDLMYGIRAGWIFRINREPKAFYYN